MKDSALRRLNRRAFIKQTALVSGGIALLPATLASCDDDTENPAYSGDFGFREGVASFDPSADGVIIWTRYTTATNEPAPAAITWEVADDSRFSVVKATGTLPATPDTDFTVWVNVTGLAANQKYYYRFLNAQTKLLP
ncbi:PhoD-like phosphatase N-terminal domain-containing protein [Hymenobacter sp. AT01-02]|uniref:PhoD-like phosphatase N-terminal domain-containing protein n=1 Tax=Hymenobacter sp. AT01-02 TaxID=1571877 RepID=UPI00191BE31C|nr:PhoD-like phosphatase N-terminal domain-containing protein [Hymenobacter sp. AT01-02]